MTMSLPQGPKRFKRSKIVFHRKWLLLGDTLGTCQSPESKPQFPPFSLRGKRRPASRRDKCPPPLPPRPISYSECVSEFEPKGKSSSRHRLTLWEAELSARCSLQGPFPAREQGWCEQGPSFHRYSRLRLREHLLPASLGRLPTPPPSSRGPCPRPESWKRNRAQEPTNLLGNLGPVAEPRWSMKEHKTSGHFQLSSSKVPGRSGLRVLSASPSPRPHPASQPSSWGAGSLPTKAARVSTQSHSAMASSALLSIPHPAPGSAQNWGAGPVSPGPPRQEGVEVDRALQRRTLGCAGRGCLGSGLGCRVARGRR